MAHYVNQGNKLRMPWFHGLLRVSRTVYLKLSVAGHLTIFLTRTRGPFWSIPPARILLVAVLGTQALATLIAVYGLFMMPSSRLRRRVRTPHWL